MASSRNMSSSCRLRAVGGRKIFKTHRDVLGYLMHPAAVDAVTPTKSVQKAASLFFQKENGAGHCENV